jgi:4-hydroxybenzoate polyprenyltransferase
MPEPAETEPAPISDAPKPSDDASDIEAGGWIEKYVPAHARPYVLLARLDRPVGIWLLLLPCWWSAALAAKGIPSWTLLLLFAVGAVIMRAAGCTLNDIADRDFDAQVARTRNRPIASGAIGLRAAHIFLGALLIAGLAVLLCFNREATIVGVASLPLVLIYPFMKRLTDWPQAWLGLTFNWGALMGWAAVTNDLAMPAFLLYAGGFFWTLGYDTIYAHQDRQDDLLIGVRSSALRLGNRTRPFLYVCYGLCLALIAAAGLKAGLGVVFLAWLAPAAVLLLWQTLSVRLDEPADCLAKFRSNLWFGLIVFAAIVAARVIEAGI